MFSENKKKIVLNSLLQNTCQDSDSRKIDLYKGGHGFEYKVTIFFVVIIRKAHQITRKQSLAFAIAIDV